MIAVELSTLFSSSFSKIQNFLLKFRLAFSSEKLNETIDDYADWFINKPALSYPVSIKFEQFSRSLSQNYNFWCVSIEL